MTKMGAVEVLVVTISHNVSFMGKMWWMVMVVVRLFVVLLAGFTLFGDEQERFVCNTIQPGCSSVCFNGFAPVSLLRLWLFHLVLLCLPHVTFATYVTHEALRSHRAAAAGAYGRDGGRVCSRRTSTENSSSSREASLSKAPLRAACPPCDCAAASFHGAYCLVVVLRLLLEAAFAGCQLFLFGFSIPESFLCYEAPCTSGVQCYVSRPTEKTLMLNFMLGAVAVSVLLSLLDLVISMKTETERRRARGEKLMEEMSRGEQSSVFTSMSGTEDTDVLLVKRAVRSGSLMSDGKSGEAHAAGNAANRVVPSARFNGGTNLKTGVSIVEKASMGRDDKLEAPHPSKPTETPSLGRFMNHNHLRPPLSPQQGRGPAQSSADPTSGGRKVGQYASASIDSDQQSDYSNISDAKDNRAWV